MKKKIAIPIVIVLICLIGLYFFTPGVVLGDIRHINADSQIQVSVMRLYRRTGLHEGLLGSEWVETIDLNTEQIATLRDLLRGAWYTRTPGRPLVQTLHFPDDWDYYYTFRIFHRRADGRLSDIDIGHDGRVLRSNHRFSRLRIRNADWNAAMLEILR